MDLIEIGSKLARLREAQGLSSSRLAETLGISRGYLSRVENGRQVPSLVTLDAIAREFGVELGYFFGPSSDGHVVPHRGVAAITTVFGPEATFTYEALCTARAAKRAHPFLAIFRPGTRTQVAVHDAEYFRYVIAGRIVMHYDGERYPLAAGDAVYYDASIAHEFECEGDEPARVVTLFIKPASLAVINGRTTTLEGHL